MKKLLSFFLSILFVLACPTNVFRTSASFSENFCLTLISDKDIDLSNIEISIYKQINIMNHTENLTTFDKEYFSSAVSNANGEISFKKPQAPFVIEFNMETLPSGTGVKKQTLTYSENVNTDNILIYTISDIEAVFVYDELNFHFKNSDNENVLANYEIVSHDIDERLMTTTMGSNTISCALQHHGQINVNGTSFAYTISQEYLDMTEIEHTELLYNHGLITEEKRLANICSVLQKENGDQYITTELLELLKSYEKNTSASALQKMASDTLYEIEESYIDDPSTLTYVSRTFYCNHTECCENGIHNIKIYYCSSTCTTNVANQYADSILSVFSYFINQLGFRCPVSIDYTPEISNINDSFCVLITTKDNFLACVAWGTQSNSKSGAYIIINQNLVDEDGVNRRDTCMAHEFQHCIQNQYSLNSDLAWKESCAMLASMLYAQNILNDLSTRYHEYKDGVKAYLKETQKSLIDMSSGRVYSVLFPLKLFQAYNGMDTIKKIYEEMHQIRNTSSTNNDAQIFEAINNVLTDDGDNLRQVLEDFGKMNYNYSSSYNLLRNSAWHDVQITNTTLTRAVTYSSVIQSTGYGYYELSSSPDTVTITLQLAGNAPTAVTCWIIEGFGTNNVAKSTKIRLTSRQLTLSYTLTNALAEDLCLIIENTSTSNNATVSITVN